MAFHVQRDELSGDKDFVFNVNAPSFLVFDVNVFLVFFFVCSMSLSDV